MRKRQYNNKSGLFFLAFLLVASSSAADKITPSEVFSQAAQIDKEVMLILQHFGIQRENQYRPIKADLEPRNVWQKSYFVLVKINIFRRKNTFPAIAVNSLEPVLKLDPLLVFEQTQRILTELHLIKRRLNINKETSPPVYIPGKRPIDVYNLLHKTSLDLDILNNETINPSYVYAEVMRIFEDTNAILRKLRLEDPTFPPEKVNNITPKESLAAVFDLMKEIQRLQRGIGIKRVDFSVFRGEKKIQPSEVFNMVGMSLAELQPIKAHLDLKHRITPPAEFHEEKTPSDVHQLLRWVIRKIQLIKSL